MTSIANCRQRSVWEIADLEEKKRVPDPPPIPSLHSMSRPHVLSAFLVDGHQVGEPTAQLVVIPLFMGVWARESILPSRQHLLPLSHHHNRCHRPRAQCTMIEAQGGGLRARLSLSKFGNWWNSDDGPVPSPSIFHSTVADVSVDLGSILSFGKGGFFPLPPLRTRAQ